MMRTRLLTFGLIFFGWVWMSCDSGMEHSEKERPTITLKAQLVTDEISNPVALAETPDGRLFIVQQDGKIWVIKGDKVLKEPLLDLTSKMVKVNKGYDERGLLGIALSPDFAQNGKLYVYFGVPTSTGGMNHKNVLAEFRISSDNPNKVDLSSERKILEIQEPEFNHEGGCLVFGPDRYLYIGVGDGGGGGDRHGSIGNGQNLNTWLGKILRIDVNGSPYRIPKDNPFVDKSQVKPEIWAYGLRNPWRFSFDKKTDELFAADVGQNKYEEVDIIKKGGNYGWRIMEGFHVYNMPKDADTSDLIPPIDEYPHSVGISVIGGYVYRGKVLPEMQGKYIFGDYNGKFFALSKTSDSKWERENIEIEWDGKKSFQLYSFGEDNAGEIYILGRSGNHQGMVLKLVNL